MLRAVFGAIALLSAWCLAGFAAAQAPAPISAYARLPAMEAAAISPDGTKIAMLRAYANQMAVEVFDTKTMARIAAKAQEGDMKFRDVSWSADGATLLITVSQTFNPFTGTRLTGSFLRTNVTDARGSYEYYRLVAVPLAAGAPVYLLHNTEMSRVSTGITSWWHAADDEPNAVRMAAYNRNGLWSMHRVDLATGSGEPLVLGADQTANFIASAGKVHGRVDLWPNKDEWVLQEYKGGGWREVLRERSEAGISPVLRSPFSDGKFAMLQSRETGRVALYSIDPANGAIALVLAHPQHDITDVEYDPHTNIVVGVGYATDVNTQSFFDPALESVRLKVLEFFKSGHAKIVSWDRTRSVFAVRGFRGSEPPGYYLYRTSDGSMSALINTYPELESAAVGRRLFIKYKAADGTSIPAYVTLPEGSQMKGFPLVVLVHGGPQGRDTGEFDWMASFLASRGYAVLQPNFRGSIGYGYAWREAGHGQWGKLMQTDVSDGVAALAKNGMIDPKRVCIAGVDYGGYAALAGATLTPDTYACAISIAGIADLDLFVAREQERTVQGGARRDSFALSLGDAYSSGAARKAISPSDNAANVRAPILLIHGSMDSTVTADQSKRFAKRLTDLGKNVQYVELNADDHYLSFNASRVQTLEAMEAFLAKNLPVQ